MITIGNCQRDHHPLSSSLVAVSVYQISEVQLLSTWRFSVLILPLVLLVKTLQSVFDIISNLNPLPRELHGMKYSKMLQMGPGKVCQNLTLQYTFRGTSRASNVASAV